MSTLIIAALLSVTAFTLIISAVVTRYRVANPDEAIILTGKRPRAGEPASQKVIIGGGTFVWPFIQKAHKMNLSVRSINIQIAEVTNVQGIELMLEGVAMVKVGGTDEMVRAAAQRYLSQQEKIDLDVQDTLAGGLRDIVGTMTVEEIIRDRKAFAERAAEIAEGVLSNQGLVLDTFKIMSVKDSGDYLKNLGRPDQAKVRQEAEIKEIAARQQTEQQRIAAEQRILNAQRELALRQAEITAETDAAKAKAAVAGPLEKAARDQELLAQQELVAKQQATLTDTELDSRIRKPADAARYEKEQQAEARRVEVEKQAEAEKVRVTLLAEANAKQAELTGAGELSRRKALAEAESVEGLKAAEAIKARGLAEAEVIAEKGIAEAAAIEKKAEAFQTYNEAAVLELIVKELPAIAHNIATPMSNIKELTIVSNDGAGALSKQVNATFLDLQTLLKTSTGVDLTKLVSSLDKTSTATENVKGKQ